MNRPLAPLLGNVSSREEARRTFVNAFAIDPIACSTLQPGLEYVDTAHGFIAYRRAAGFDVALGPPVCAPDAPADKLALLEKFVSAARRPLFVYLRGDDATLAQYAAGGRAQYVKCGMGVDKLVPLDDVTARAHSAKVSAALRKAARAGLVVDEVSSIDAQLAARLRAITAKYLERSAVPVEMRFLNRPLELSERDVGRVFTLRTERDGLFGYAVLDPYRGGALLNLLRFEETKLWGVYYAVAATLAERLRAEGARELSLGWSPLVDVDVAGAPPLLARQVRWMERRFLEVAYLARLKEMKEAFAGRTEQRYVVAPSLGPALGPALVLSLIRASGVPLTWMIGPQLAKAFTPRLARR